MDDETLKANPSELLDSEHEISSAELEIVLQRRSHCPIFLYKAEMKETIEKGVHHMIIIMDEVQLYNL